MCFVGPSYLLLIFKGTVDLVVSCVFLLEQISGKFGGSAILLALWGLVLAL